VLSFLVIGLLWMAHHNQFSFIARVDGVMMWLNLLLLLMIGLIPFVTTVMCEHATPAADHALRCGAVLDERAAWRHLGLCASRSRADGGGRPKWTWLLALPAGRVAAECMPVAALP
jgi:hypothetical protein